MTAKKKTAPSLEKKVYFIPLGGSGEIGMNLNVYGYDDQWIIVDFGISFGSTLGIEVLVPDISWLKGKTILGIVITHGHEDHIGAIPYLWPHLKCPIYATPFTASLIKRKLKEIGCGENAVRVTPLQSTFKLGDFSLEYITTTHSIPEPNALAIQTPVGTILHTGDWKLDEAPLVGKETDINRFQTLGNEGILALVGDSTNALERGFSGSELQVRHELVELVESITTGTIVVTCFSSNVARLETCLMAAKATGRQPILVGRSLQNMYQSARENGYLEKWQFLWNEKNYKQLKREEVLIVCTGSQGEPRSALTNIAFQRHQNVRLAAGDTVIFSSRIIPGNEKNIGRVQNRLVEDSIRVITPQQTAIHVSGHPCQDELRQMYEWVRPRIALPVHGEARHVRAHGDIAREKGVQTVHIPKNGELLSITADGVITVEGTFSLMAQAIDGDVLIPLNAQTFQDRSKLMLSGCVFVSVLLNKRSVVEDVRVHTMGVFPFVSDMENALAKDVNRAIDQALLDNDEPSLTHLESLVHQMIRRVVSHETGKKPLCTVHICRA